MKKYILISLGIILVGILTSSVFLWIALGEKVFMGNLLIEESALIQESRNNNAKNAKNEPLSDVLLKNEFSSSELRNTIEDNEVDIEIPNFIENQAPFISQAPFGIWDELHNEACEEAVLIIANGFLNGIEEISNKDADKEILNLVDWQMEKYGEHKDLNIQEIQEMALEFYGNEFKISSNVSSKTFKEVLSGESIMIIPAAGRELQNPFFTPPGPLYHALVVIGYDDSTKEFITNDPGTKRGEGFRYSYETLLAAIHDFPGKKEKILEGVPRVLIVKGTN